LFVAVHSDPEVGDAVLKFFGHQPTAICYQELEFEHTGKNAVVLFSDSVTARILMTKPCDLFRDVPAKRAETHSIWTD
jgi:hypothetical protein